MWLQYNWLVTWIRARHNDASVHVYEYRAGGGVAKEQRLSARQFVKRERSLERYGGESAARFKPQLREDEGQTQGGVQLPQSSPAD